MNLRNTLVLPLIAAACGSALAGAPSAPASDVVKIDQAKAIAGGVTSADAAGFPVVINAPGSYKLTSNLVVPAGQDAIHVMASNVTIDLNGFAILGPGNCSGTGNSMLCTANAGHGVYQVDSNNHNLIVQNGTVGGFGQCMYGGRATRLTDLSLHDCASAMFAGNGSIVSRVAINRSQSAGAIYGSTADQVQVYWASLGLSTSNSILRGISMNSVYRAFELSGSANSALSMSAIVATTLGNGYQSVGGNLCNGVAC